jgi:hypothetical protein
MNEEQKQELINFAVDVKRLAKALAKLMPQFEEYAYDLQHDPRRRSGREGERRVGEC